MRKITKTILIILIAVALAIIAFCIFYLGRFETMASIEKLSDYDDGYNLYSMDVKYDYSTQDVIDSGFADTQGYVDAVIKESLPLLPVKMELPEYGCSTYSAKADDGDAIMGRNYDFKLDTSCMVVNCSPRDGFRSIGFAALDNMGADSADKSISSKMACLTAPFGCLGGINEKGVSIAVLTLDSDPTDQNTGREKVTPSLAIRLVLDNAATTEEAVELIDSYDMYAVNGRDYHLFISDATGDSRVVEYDCEDEDRAMVATPVQAATNFFAMYADKVKPNQHNGIYGLGKERYDIVMKIIEQNGGKLTEETAWAALRKVSSDRDPENVTSNTQWSIVYNNTEKTAKVVLRRNWGDVFSFDIK